MAKSRTPKKTNLPAVQAGGIRAEGAALADQPDLRRIKNFEVVMNEEGSILTDYIRQYVGTARAVADATSGVFLQQDRILLTQSYNDQWGYDLYDEIERDPHIHSVLSVRKQAVAGLDWAIDPASEDPTDIKIAAMIQEKIVRAVGFSQDMIELLDAVHKGFAVSEIIWDVDSDGIVVPKQLMNRPQRRFQFDANSRALKIRRSDNPFYGTPVSDMKFIVHRNSQKYENPFGDALGQRLFWPFLFKRMVQKFWMQHAETGSAPVPLVKHQRNASAELKTEALAIAQQIRVGSYGRIPEDFEILWAETKNVLNTGQSYEMFLRFNNDEITKCVLGQILTTEASGSSGSGSKALGGVHNQIREDILKYDATALAETLTDTLIKWMCDYNFPDLKQYPAFRFDTDSPVEIKGITEAIKNLEGAGHRVDPAWIEDTTGIQLLKDDQGNFVSGAIQAPAQFAEKRERLAAKIEERKKYERRIKQIISAHFKEQRRQIQENFSEAGEKTDEELLARQGYFMERSSSRSPVTFDQKGVTVKSPDITVRPPNIVVNIPEQKPPDVKITVNVPRQKPPKVDVNVQASPAPKVSITMPEIKAPDVHVHMPEPAGEPKKKPVDAEIIRDADGRIKEIREKR